MPRATWNGPFDALLPGRRVLRIGDELEITEEESRSAHWTVLSDSPAPTVAKFTPTDKTDSEGGDD